MTKPLRDNRDFRLLWLSGLFAVLGAQMSALALPLLVLKETGSAVQAGAVGTVSVGAVLITMLPGGVMADRVERRRLMRLCDVGSLTVVTALTVAVWSGHAPMPLVLLVAAAGAILSSIYGPAVFGLMRAVVPADQMGTATARLQARTHTARLVGPLLGGALFGIHPALPFAAEALGLLLSTVCVTLVRTRSRARKTAGAVFSRRELLAGLTFLWKIPYLRTVLLVFGLGMNFAFGALTFTALTAFSEGGRSGVGGGFVITCVSAGALAGALLAPRIGPDRHSRALILATCWACVTAAGVMAWTEQSLVAGIMCALCMCLSTIASIGFLSKLLIVTPDERVGRVQSAAGFLSSMVQPFGPLAGGALLSAFGARWAFVLTGCVLAGSALVVTFAPSARTVPEPHDDAAEPSGPPGAAPPGAGADRAAAGAPRADLGD
ncbi:MFS transporter [Streptomyces nitrosporeus]|uniref:MFS transporter n=1 Tax=Streptomyces nitrosporeus TaxID=28894 RepID=A0A5J6FEA9_9ACTN|nr:MFS transporter [Streptomyces nitrosporeus]QEU74391.1 MFS transporter [Streptomyces nitrosporeus]GGY95887.1 MFS transporter [Streptomyces nitrosporeus]